MTTQISQPQNDIDVMAAEFSDLLKSWLSPEEMEEVVRRNEGEDDLNICHSHDFCDANMALHEVFMRHGMDVTDEQGASRFGQKWGEVWQLAKGKQFWTQ
ncbi:MAG: hypothetical protein Q8O37_08650 [Sulfuricellaceae bacterium]|nr:hypothetical protein [Sulfuricellaceae bacterium]